MIEMMIILSDSLVPVKWQLIMNHERFQQWPG
jgi:hypothetical protein